MDYRNIFGLFPLQIFLGIVLYKHFAKHFNESGSGIRFVLDIYIFLEAKKKELHPEYLKKKQKELGLEEFCREMEEIAYRWFDGRPEIRDSKYETVILLAGIFGIRQWAYAGQQKKYLEKFLAHRTLAEYGICGSNPGSIFSGR